MLDDRLDVAQGAAAVQLRPSSWCRCCGPTATRWTRSECESVATNLRMLAEQINDRGRTGLRSDPRVEDHEAMARSIGEMAQALR